MVIHIAPLHLRSRASDVILGSCMIILNAGWNSTWWKVGFESTHELEHQVLPTSLRHYT